MFCIFILLSTLISSDRRLMVFIDWDGTLAPERSSPKPSEPKPPMEAMPDEARNRIENIFSEIISRGGKIVILTGSEKESLDPNDPRKVNTISRELVRIESTRSDDTRNIPEDKVQKMFDICEEDGVAFPSGILFLDNDERNVAHARKCGIHTVCYPIEIQRKTFPQGKVYGDPNDDAFYQHLDYLLEDFIAKLHWDDVENTGLFDTPEMGPTSNLDITPDVVLPQSVKEFSMRRPSWDEQEERASRILNMGTERMKQALSERRRKRDHEILNKT